MKKLNNFKWFSLGVFMCLVVTLLVSPAMASSLSKTATLVYSNIKITLDGNAVIPKDANGNVVEPFAIDGVTYLPIRGISNALGLGVDWDGETSTVKLTSGSGSGALGDYAVKIDGFRRVIDYNANPAVIITYTFTNNSTKETSAVSVLNVYLYQNNATCELTLVGDYTGTFLIENNKRPILPGDSITCEYAFITKDKSPIDVEILRWQVKDGPKVTQTFTLD